MKITLWGHHNAPTLTKASNNTVLFYDYPTLWDFEVGDRIETYALGVERITLRVTKVEPANLTNFPDEMRLVTATICGT